MNTPFIKRLTILCSSFLLIVVSKSQGIDSTSAPYNYAYNKLYTMLSEQEKPSFKKAVFLTENAFYDNQLSYNDFLEQINNLALLANTWAKSNPIVKYKYSDSLEVNKCFAINKLMKDTIKLQLSDNKLYKLVPYSFDFVDFFGERNWVKTFVTKLLNTNSGNCRSLSYLYKIMADELGVKNVWLSFAPYHIYIKNRSKQIGWYNTELTSGQFPIDAWVMTSGYVSPDAVRSGIYMDTLSNQQAVANCALDLAKGYEKKYKIYTDSFIVKCCDLTLKYHPNNINAIIYKAETLKKMYLVYQKENPTLAATVYPDMEKLYVKALDLGYKEMPEKMYREWLISVTKQKNKYTNKQLKTTLTGK